MKKITEYIYFSLIAIIVLLKVLNWFLTFAPQYNSILNILMYSLIGIGFIYSGIRKNELIKRYVFILSGSYLIVFNFLYKTHILFIIAIICIVVPLIIMQFDKAAGRE